MNKLELIETLRGMRPTLSREGVAHIAIFGSRARGDEREASDLDLLIEVKPDALFSLLNLVGVEQMVSDRTGLEVNAIVRRGLDERLRSDIAEDLVTVF